MGVNDLLDDFKAVMHSIRVKLYPNYLPAVEGKYIARTENEKVLTIKDILAALRDRGGYKGDLDQLYDGIRKFYGEMIFQLLNGFGVNTGLYYIRVNIGGTFESENEVHDKKKHPISFRMTPQLLLRQQVKYIDVVNTGPAGYKAWIDQFLDGENESINNFYEPGNQFMLTGHKIKIAGDDPDCGLYFNSVNPAEPPVKVRRIIENNPTKIIGIIPETGHGNPCKIEIRSQFSGSGGKILKAPRVITSSFTLEHV